jgi:hypothetical protein
LDGQISVGIDQDELFDLAQIPIVVGPYTHILPYVHKGRQGKDTMHHSYHDHHGPMLIYASSRIWEKVLRKENQSTDAVTDATFREMKE